MVSRRWTLPEYADMFKDIYLTRNLSLTREETLHRLIEEIAEIVRPVLVYDLEAIKWDLPDIFAWICAFANKSHIDLQDIMDKYIKNPPGKTGAQSKVKPIDIIGVSMPETLEEWQRYLSVLYRNENSNIPPDLMISKIIEDVGLTSRKLRTWGDISEIENHLAGAFAWTIALANKFQVELDDEVYRKYPNYCFKCKNKPCKCFKLSTVFISYTKDTAEEMHMVKRLLKQLHLRAETFEELGPPFRRIRMVEAFDAINRSNGCITLLKSHWSENVWAELIEVLRTIDENNVWICVGKSKKPIDDRLQVMLKDVECFHMIQHYSDKKELHSLLKKGITARVQELKHLQAKNRPRVHALA